MVVCAGRPGRSRGALACALLASLLAACGGGGTGGSTPGAGGATGPESARLLAEFVARDSNHQVVRVWDPAHPAVAIQEVQITVSNGIAWTASHLVFSDATRYDADTRQVTTLGHARVFYDNDGRLYTIDLRGGHSHVPVQLSSAVDVFTTVNAFPMSADGADAWVDVRGGAHDWAIRSSMAATDAPLPVWRIEAALRDPATGLPAYFLASQGSVSGTVQTPRTFEVFDPSFNAVAQPEVATMDGFDAWLGADPAQGGLGYLKMGGVLRALRWSSLSVTVDAAHLHDFANAGLGSYCAADADALYVSDGLQVVAVANTAVRTVGTLSALPGALVEAGTYVVATENVSALPTTTQVETLRKADGARTLLEPATAGLRLLGAGAAAIALAGTPEAGQAIVLASGDNLARVTVGSQFVGLVRAPVRLLDQPAAASALLSCVAGATPGYCGVGTLSRTPIGTPASSVSLGTLASSSAWVRADLTEGLAGVLGGQTFLPAPGGLGSNEVDVRDAWQVTPDTAGSLVRVTSDLR